MIVSKLSRQCLVPPCQLGHPPGKQFFNVFVIDAPLDHSITRALTYHHLVPAASPTCERVSIDLRFDYHRCVEVGRDICSTRSSFLAELQAHGAGASMQQMAKPRPHVRRVLRLCYGHPFQHSDFSFAAAKSFLGNSSQRRLGQSRPSRAAQQSSHVRGAPEAEFTRLRSSTARRPNRFRALHIS